MGTDKNRYGFPGIAGYTSKGCFLVVRKRWLALRVPSTVSRAGEVSLVWIKAAFPEDGKEVFLL